MLMPTELSMVHSVTPGYFTKKSNIAEDNFPFVCRAVAKVFKGKTIEKGVAFPTCVSVNKCAITRHIVTASSDN